MSAFLYFWRTSLKNRLLILRRKPAKLIAYLFMLIMIVALIMVSMIGLSNSDRQNTDPVYLGLLILGISYFLFAMGWSKGCKQGTSFFKMADVNLLFTSPLRPQNILAFGLINQMGTVLMSTFFLLYQIPNLVNQFDLSGVSVLMIFLAWMLMLFSSEVVALGLYNLTVTRVWLRSWLSRLPLIVAALLAVLVLMKSRLQQISLLEAAVNTFDRTFLHLFPVTGWITGWTMGMIQGHWQSALLDFLLLAATLFILIAVVWRSDADYYEDVLVATEKKFNMLQAAKEGRRVMSDQPERKWFVNRKASLFAGWGASVFFYRQWLVFRRQSRFGFITGGLVVYTAAGFGLWFFMRDQPDIYRLLILPAGLFVLYLVSRFNEWQQELKKPWIYLAPLSPARKLFWATLPDAVKTFLNSLPFFMIAVIAGKYPVGLTLTGLLALTSFDFVFTAASILVRRLLGHDIGKGLDSLLMLLIEYLLLAPGIVLLIVGYVLEQPMLAQILIVLCNGVLYGLSLLICRNLLHQMES